MFIDTTNNSTDSINITNTRVCSFCNRKEIYDDFPDGSVCWLGICACADCLEKEETKEFREVLNAQ